MWIFTGLFRYVVLGLGIIGGVLATIAKIKLDARREAKQRQLAEEARRVKVRENIEKEVANVKDSDLDARLGRGGWLRE